MPQLHADIEGKQGYRKGRSGAIVPVTLSARRVGPEPAQARRGDRRWRADGNDRAERNAGDNGAVIGRAHIWPVVPATHSNGIYFLDYPEIAHFVCPEWSHLTPTDAIAYTKALIPLLPKTFVQ